MHPRPFSPGFRLSLIDVVVLIAGSVGAVLLWSITWWWGFVVAFVIAHFFLFCNIVRASRPLELCWAGVFIVLASGTITLEIPVWPVTIAASLMATILVVMIEMRKPSYHGIGWQIVNPALHSWWEAHVVARSQQVNTSDDSEKGRN